MKTKLGVSVLAIIVTVMTLAQNPQAQPKDASLSMLNEKLVEVSKKVTPAVVNISAQRERASKSLDQMRSPGDPFDENLPPLPKTPDSRISRGSGIIFNEKGYIVTNNHVIKEAGSIKVTLSNKQEFRCSVVGTDPATDIAVIKMDEPPKNLPTLKIGNSDAIRVGELVIAVGNPFGFSHTVTMGIVSATGRQNVGLAEYEEYIQTDAAINPGNSGGALVNIKGELIGINTAIYSRSGGSLGIGFAIPSNMAKQVVEEIIKSGKVVRGWLGVYIQDITKDIAQSFKYGKENGALVSDVMKGSPAEKSALKAGDIITKIDERDIIDVHHLRKLVAWKKPGTSVKVSIFRDGKELDLSLPVGVMPERKAEIIPALDRFDDIGITVKNLTEELAYKWRIKEQNGVVVMRMKEYSPAFNAGMRVGDLIREIERTPIADTKDYKSIMSEHRERKHLLLLIQRAGVNKYVVINRE